MTHAYQIGDRALCKPTDEFGEPDIIKVERINGETMVYVRDVPAYPLWVFIGNFCPFDPPDRWAFVCPTCEGEGEIFTGVICESNMMREKMPCDNPCDSGTIYKAVRDVELLPWWQIKYQRIARDERDRWPEYEDGRISPRSIELDSITGFSGSDYLFSAVLE